MTKSNGTHTVNASLSAWAGFTAGVIASFAYIIRKQRQAAEGDLAEIADMLDEMDEFDDVERHFTRQYNVGDPVRTLDFEDWTTGDIHPPITDATITHAQYDAGLGEWVYGIDKSSGMFVGGVLEYDEQRAETMLREQEAALQAEIDELLDRKNDAAVLYRMTGDAEYEEQGRQIGVTLTGKATALEQIRASIEEVSEK
ncbi:hypothetical protein [Salibacterium aidingense]|uniref:hypothetical protein n=1 Tax=Salibacterium aidingense TaxID=384933 RepID=UPI003BDCE86C